jgi:hypothetical protein
LDSRNTPAHDAKLNESSSSSTLSLAQFAINSVQ